MLTRISTLYNLPLWLVDAGAIAIFIVLLAFPFVVRHLLLPKYYRFRELIEFKVLWRWKYEKSDIIGLWCYCPKCEALLMCDDENCRSNTVLQNKITYFICNECHGKECGRVIGGDRRYALSLVKREIWRHINAGSFTEVSKVTKEALRLYQSLEETNVGIDDAMQTVYEQYEAVLEESETTEETAIKDTNSLQESNELDLKEQEESVKHGV